MKDYTPYLPGMRLCQTRKRLEKRINENGLCAISTGRADSVLIAFPGKATKRQLHTTVPQTDTGARDEYSKALERTLEKVRVAGCWMSRFKRVGVPFRQIRRA